MDEKGEAPTIHRRLDALDERAEAADAEVVRPISSCRVAAFC